MAKTNDAFSTVADGAKKVGELVEEISAATNEQAQGVDQLNRAIMEMEKVVQTNAAGAEESAAAAGEMQAQAEQMKFHVADLVRIVGGAGNAVIPGSLSSPTGTGRERGAAKSARALMQ